MCIHHQVKIQSNNHYRERREGCSLRERSSLLSAVENFEDVCAYDLEYICY